MLKLYKMFDIGKKRLKDLHNIKVSNQMDLCSTEIKPTRLEYPETEPKKYH